MTHRCARRALHAASAIAVAWVLAGGPAPAGAAGATPPNPRVGVVYLRDGDSLAVTEVRPWAQDAVRYVTASGEIGYLTANKITRIVDARGSDLTQVVLRDREPLTDPGGIRTRELPRLLAAPSTRGRGYFVTEVVMVGPDGLGSERGDGVLFSAGIGGMGPLSPSWSLGAVAHATVGDDDYLGGDIGIRARRYLTERSSLDLTAAAFGGESNFWKTDGAGLSLEATYTHADVVSFVVRVDRARWAADLDAWDFYRHQKVEAHRSATKLRAGVRVGPSPRLLSVAGVVGGLLAFYLVAVARAT